MSEASANVESEVAASAGSPVKPVNLPAAAVQPDAKGDDPKPGPSTDES